MVLGEAMMTGSALGLVAGLAPGPFVAFVAATAAEHGLRAGLRVALAPLLVEPPALLAAVLVLSQVPQAVLRWVGMIGGAAMIVLGLSVFRRAGQSKRRRHRSREEKEGTWNMLKLAGAGLVSPAPWVFWTAIGGPLFLRNWHRGVTAAILFLGTFLACLVGSQMAVAVGASRGVKRLKGSWHPRVIRAMSAILVVAGMLLAWQAWTGNFHKLIAAQRRVERFVR